LLKVVFWMNIFASLVRKFIFKACSSVISVTASSLALTGILQKNDVFDNDQINDIVLWKPSFFSSLEDIS
jgi:hypothetical protein